jgi:hypothetical protein
MLTKPRVVKYEREKYILKCSFSFLISRNLKRCDRNGGKKEEPWLGPYVIVEDK